MRRQTHAQRDIRVPLVSGLAIEASSDAKTAGGLHTAIRLARMAIRWL
jgi:hypothetical protein